MALSSVSSLPVYCAFGIVSPLHPAQDLAEATSNVQKRLDFIGAELERLDSQLKAHQDRQARREQQVGLLSSATRKINSRTLETTPRM